MWPLQAQGNSGIRNIELKGVIQGGITPSQRLYLYKMLWCSLSVQDTL